MSDNDIGALLGFLKLASIGSYAMIPSRVAADYHAALDKFVVERDGLAKRVAELESPPPADRDRELRERLVCAALTGLNSNPDFTENAFDLPRWAINQADQVLAAMRKGEQP